MNVNIYLTKKIVCCNFFPFSPKIWNWLLLDENPLLSFGKMFYDKTLLWEYASIYSKFGSTAYNYLVVYKKNKYFPNIHIDM